MANPIDLAIRVKADTKRLWDDLTKVDRKADETKRKVEAVGTATAKVARQAQQASTSMQTRFGRVSQGLGMARGVLTAGGSLSEAAIYGFGSALPELAAALVAVNQANQVIDAPGRAAVAAAQPQLTSPTSIADAIAGLEKARNRSKGILGFGRRVLETRSPFLGGSYRPSELGRAERERYHGAFRTLVQTNPALALDVLATMGNPDDLTRIYRDETAKMTAAQTRAAESQAFMTRYPSTSVTVNAAVNLNDRVGAGRGSVGRQVTEYQDSRDRNNGRYVATSGRRR